MHCVNALSSDADKNDEEKKVEAEILSEILKIVESRNKIVESIETDRIRLILSTYYWSITVSEIF